jgi:putative zinc finger protein
MTGRLETTGAKPAGEHPEAIVTAAYLDGTLTPSARDALEAHLAACDECRAGVALLRLRGVGGTEDVPPEMLRRARALATEPAASSSAGARRRYALPAGLAAGLLAVAGLAFWLRGEVGSRRPVERKGAAPAIQALDPGRGEAVEAAHLAFRFTPVEGADRYVVTLLDAGGSEVGVIETGPPGGHVPWPADRELPPPGTYMWSVRALVLDRILAETRPLPFEIR